ncbi:hypothetical protein BVX98_07740 [bacterium F11]|nr:hypothetical protein BVX98_07740 [bacterium F11]
MEKKKFDLLERTMKFAYELRRLLQELNPNDISSEDRKQLLRSSGSVGANYVEANESISKKDFVLRIRICKKEAMESMYWLELIKRTGDSNKREYIEKFIQEAKELGRIFGAIINKCQ